jgi:hypothetical protein
MAFGTLPNGLLLPAQFNRAGALLYHADESVAIDPQSSDRRLTARHRASVAI